MTVGKFGSIPPPVPVNPGQGHSDWKAWTTWRADDLTEFLAQLHRDIKAVGSRKGEKLFSISIS